jgi:hypothetical protein
MEISNNNYSNQSCATNGPLGVTREVFIFEIRKRQGCAAA